MIKYDDDDDNDDDNNEDDDDNDNDNDDDVKRLNDFFTQMVKRIFRG